MDIIDVINEISLPREAAENALAVASKLSDGDVARLREIFLSSESARSDLYDYADSLGISRYSLALTAALLTAPVTVEKMQEQGMTRENITLSLRDVTVWCKVCKRDFDEWGLHEIAWIERTLRAELWRLGRLQFEEIEFEYDDVALPGGVIKRGDIVVNTHIPEDGPIPRRARYESYYAARDFFGNDKFIIDTYLLYPAQRDFLPPDSNVRDFMDDFYTFKSGECDDYRDMWRLFGRRDKWDPAELPRDTSLHRAYAEHLALTGKCGWGVGAMILDDAAALRAKGN